MNLSRLPKLCLFIFALSSCVLKNNEPPQIRIVGINGKPGNVVTRTPDLNSQAMLIQGNASSKKNQTPAQDKPNSSATTQAISASNGQNHAKDNVVDDRLQASQKFGSASSDIIQKTFQTSPGKAPNQYDPTPDNDQDFAQDNKTAALGTPEASKKNTIEYDLSTSESGDESAAEVAVPSAAPPVVTAEKIKQPKERKTETKQQKRKAGYYVQVGSFSDLSNAKKLSKSMQKFNKNSNVETSSGDHIIHRVLLGPFKDKQDARAMITKVGKSGQDAILVK